MRALWTSEEIAAATGGTATAAFDVDAVSFDSREVIGGELFVALTGEAADGHAFVDMAMKRGARGCLVSRAVDAPHVLVPDTMAGLEALGAAARARTDACVIGVTGSVGKTGVKEALRRALDRFAPGQVHASVKSYNNHTGVPLSLARMPADSRFGVFEMGMNHAGELTALTAQVRPHIAIVTWVASAHAAYFADEVAIADAKGEIFLGLTAFPSRHPGAGRDPSSTDVSAMRSASEPLSSSPDARPVMGPGLRRDDESNDGASSKGGIAIIPHDNPHRDRLIAHARPHAARIVTFGLDPAADVHPLDYALLPDCTTCTAQIHDERLIFKIGMAGKHWLSNALAVLAGVHAAGGDLALAGLALAELTELPGRGARFRTAGQAIVIDESYNANPASMAAALGVLGEVPGRRVALLGEMRELGSRSEAFHAALAPLVTAAGVTRAILVGKAMAPLADALKRQISVRHVDTADEAAQALDLATGDVLLVKGSNGVGLGAIVAQLREEARR